MSDFSSIPKLAPITSNSNLSHLNPLTPNFLDEKQSISFLFPQFVTLLLERPDMGPRWSEDELDIFLKCIHSLLLV